MTERTDNLTAREREVYETIARYNERHGAIMETWILTDAEKRTAQRLTRKGLLHRGRPEGHDGRHTGYSTK